MNRLAGRVILLWGWRRAFLAWAAGAFAVLAQAPFDFFAAGFVSFPILVWLLDGTEATSGLGGRIRPAFTTGWWFGFGYFVASLWWVGGALLVESDDFAWALPLAVFGLPALLALFYGVAAATARLVWSDGVGRIAALAFGFGLAEWLRTFVLTGFPWNAVGYAAMPVPLLMQSVSLTGMLAMNALAVFVFALPALLASGRNARTGLTVGLLLVAAHVAFGYYRLAVPSPVPVRILHLRIVQPAIDQDEKWEDEVRDRIFATTLELTRSPLPPGMDRPELVLWPETAVPYLFSKRPDALVTLGSALEEGQMLLLGAIRAEADPSAPGGARYYNAVLAIDHTGGIVESVDKVHLVPFGEYIPLENLLGRLGVSKLVAFPESFSSGSARDAVELPGGIRLLPFVCYEIIFPHLVASGAELTDVIVNVTNDAWFGNTPGPYQHFRQAQVRAVEIGIPLIRAANTGISGVIDSRGRVVDALALNSRGTIDVSLPVHPREPALAGDPRIVGWLIMGVLAVAAGGANAAQRRRAI